MTRSADRPPTTTSVAGPGVGDLGRERPDLRLAPPAAATWLVAWQGRVLPPRVLVLLAAVLAVTAAVTLSRARARRATVLAAALGCAAAACLVTGARVHGRTHGPLVEAAGAAASVTVQAVLLDDPRVVPSRGDALAHRELIVARVRVEALEVAGRQYTLRQPLLVFSSERAWLGLLPSQRVRAEGRARPADRGDDVAALLSARGPPVVLSPPSRVHRAAGHLRQGLRDAVAPLPTAEQGLLPGLVVGDTSRLDAGLKEDFRATGLTHLVAVSGTNVAVVLGAVLLLCGWLGVGLRWRPPLAALALLGFVVLARPSPSVLRAGVMGAIAMLALATGSRRQALPALCGAVLVLLMLSPELAAQPGFALSTLATAGLLLIAPVWRDRLRDSLPRWAPSWLADALVVPAAAQLACTPVVVGISGSLGLLSVPANLLAVPAVAPATVLGVLAALLAPVWLPLAQLAAWAAYLPVAWLVLVARTGAGMPGSGAALPTGWTGVAAVSVLLVLGGLVLRSPALRRAAAAGIAGVLVALTALVVIRPVWPPPGWLLVSCDVGQGDGFVVRLGAGSAVVVDVGPDPERIDRCLQRLGVQQVPLLVLTHLHADHVEGVPGLLRGRRVGQVQIGPLDEPAVELRRLQGWLGERQVPLVRAAIGEVREVGRVRWEVVDATARRGTASDPNNSSIVIRLVTHGVSVLFAGDLEDEAQRSLLERGSELRADVLKVPHHGSRKQHVPFLMAVGAHVALTPVGAGNPYGHPAPSTLQLLRDSGARTYRSDLDGDVAVLSRGGRVSTVGRGGGGAPPAGGLAVGHGHAGGGDVLAAAPAGPEVLGRPSEPPPLLFPPGADELCATPEPAAPRGAPNVASALPRARGPPASLSCMVRTAGTPLAVRPTDAGAWEHAGMAASSPLVPLTVVVGEEDLLVSRAVSTVVRAARAQNPDTEVTDLEATGLVVSDLSELLSPSLFGDERVIILRGCQDLPKEVAAELLAYAADPLPEIHLVLLHAGGAKGKALLGQATAAGARRVDAAKVTKASERRELVRSELRSDGRQVSEDAVTMLIDAVGNDLRELCSAAGQLLSDTDGPITAEVVGRYHRGRAEASGFLIADRAVEGDLAGAVELLRWGQSTGLAHVLVTSALASTLRSVALVASAGRAPAHQLAGQLGMPPWKVEKTQRQVRGWRPEALSAAMQAVADADGDAKGGAVDAAYAVERAVLAVVQARGSGSVAGAR